MANLLQIKRSVATAAPQTLADGELAFTNAKDILFIGGSVNGAATVKQIGGAGAFLPITGGVLNGSLVIKENLTVEGTTTTINSNIVDIGDAIIKLNADIPAAQAPTENAGFEVARGSEVSAFWLWDESKDAFTGRVGTTLASIADLFNVTIDGEFLGNSLAVDTTAIIGTDLTVLEASNIGTTLTVGGRITGNGGLTITGTTSLTGNTAVAGGTFTTRGLLDEATANQVVVTNPLTTIKNALQLNETLDVTKTATFLDHASFKSGITVNGQLNLDHLVIDGNVLRANGTDATTVKMPHVDINAGTIDDTAIGVTSQASGRFTTLTATGAFLSRGIQDDATNIRLIVTNDMTTVKNESTFNGNVNMDQALSVTGAGNFSSAVGIAKNLTVSLISTLTGNVFLGANLAGAGMATSSITGFTIDGGSF